MFKHSYWLLAASIVTALPAPLGATEPSDTPLVSGTAVSVKPNVMFILDDSGSMNSETMPDDLEDWPNAVGRRSPQCNFIYYNPAITYSPPVNADGSSFPSRSFTAACSNGFSSSPGCSINLGTSFRAAPDFNGGQADSSNQAAYYYIYTGTQLGSDGKLDPVSAACKTKIDSGQSLSNSPTTYPATITSDGTGGGTWTKVTVSSTSGPSGTDERTNFANWYSYYRKRLMMMKAAGGLAFKPITNKYRVGFITINPNSPVSSSKFLPIDDFAYTDSTSQKAKWYSKLYSQSTNGSTPLREALSRVGRYFAGKSDDINSGMINTASSPPKLDPVQYSCQQNFAILTTDGYWNGNAGKKLDGTTMASTDNYDGNFSELDPNNIAGLKFAISPRPIYDGATESRTTIDKENEYQATSSGCTPVAGGTQLQERTSQLQQSTSTLTSQTSTLQSRTGTLQTCAKSLASCSAGDWSNVASCTWDTSGSSRRSCRYVWGSWANTASTCTRSYSTSTSNGAQWTGNGTDCQYTAWTSPVPATSCTAQAQSSSNPFTVITARACQTQVTTALHPVSSCTATTVPNASGETTQCAYTNWTGWTTVATCTALAQSTGPSYTVGTAKECANNTVTVPTQKLQYRTFTSTTSATFSGGIQVGGTTSSGWTPASPAWVDVPGTSCTRIDLPTVPYDPIPARRRPIAGEAPLPTAPCTAWPCVTSTTGSGGSYRSLSDVAQYYYVNDLRPTGTTGADNADVSENNVPAAGTGPEDDKATWQHMTTFTLGLGLAGELNYHPDYKTVTTGDFADIRSGTRNWPVPPDSTSLVPSKLDDLWHAAVNGRGQFFSAADPNAVISSLNKALAGINNRVASSAAAATSTLEPVAGDNFAYIAKYVTGAWTGDLDAKTIALVNDPANNIKAGDVSATPIWTAAAKLLEQTANSCDTRNIKLFRAGATNNLVDFKWNTYTCDASKVPTGSAITTLDATEQAYFNASKISALGQYSTMSDGSGGTVNQRSLAVGAPLVNFLRGQRANEGFETNSSTAFFRTRTGILGDVVNAQPLYVHGPNRNYTDPGYDAFKTAQASRTAVVYLAANDGMLHAFNAAANGGNELWAFMPSLVLPELYRLADIDYSGNHRFFVDASPVSGDVYDTAAAAWKTILVGGMNKGGKGYYALDITTPETPKALWQFTDADMGYTYGNPIIGKLNNGTWVVFLTSGLNNADGKGYLYVVNAITGAIIHKIGTTAGSAGTPSGLSKITGWVVQNADTNLTFNHIYGVDLLGNVWRFDVNDIFSPSGREASLITTLVDGSGNPQPITTKPIASLIGNDIYLYIGTGRSLHENDLTDTQTQTVYGIKDLMEFPDPPGPMIPDIRAALTQQSLMTVGEGSNAVRGFATCSTSPNGWYVDLPDAKERVTVDMKRSLGSLIVGSNVPEPSACRIGGYSWLSNFNLVSGCSSSATTPSSGSGSSSGSGGAGSLGSSVQVTINGVTKEIKVTSSRAGESLVVGVSLIMIDGKVLAVIQFSDGTTKTIDPDVLSSAPIGRRLTWREIVQQ